MDTAFVSIVVILYKATPELRTPLQSGQLDGSQWCPQYRSSTVLSMYQIHMLHVYIPYNTYTALHLRVYILKYCTVHCQVFIFLACFPEHTG